MAVDRSEEATAAAQVATEIARVAGSEVHLAYAMQKERYRPRLGPEMWEGFERAKRSGRSWAEEEAQRIRGEGADHSRYSPPDRAYGRGRSCG